MTIVDGLNNIFLLFLKVKKRMKTIKRPELLQTIRKILLFILSTGEKWGRFLKRSEDKIYKEACGGDERLIAIFQTLFIWLIFFVVAVIFILGITC